MIIRISKISPGVDPSDHYKVTVFFKELEEGPYPEARITVYIEKKDLLISEISADAIRQAYDFLSLVLAGHTLPTP